MCSGYPVIEPKLRQHPNAFSRSSLMAAEKMLMASAEQTTPLLLGGRGGSNLFAVGVSLSHFSNRLMLWAAVSEVARD